MNGLFHLWCGTYPLFQSSHVNLVAGHLFYCWTIRHHASIARCTYQFTSWWTLGLWQITLPVLFLFLDSLLPESHLALLCDPAWPRPLLSCHSLPSARIMHVHHHTQHDADLRSRVELNTCSNFSQVDTQGLSSSSNSCLHIWEMAEGFPKQPFYLKYRQQQVGVWFLNTFANVSCSLRFWV